MNEDTKLECLRLAVELSGDSNVIMEIAKDFHEWVTSEDKPNTIKYEKMLKERE